MFNDKKDLKVFCHENSVSDNGYGLLYGYPWGKIFKAELFSRIRFPNGYWFEDTVMAFVIFSMAKRVATSNVLLYHYRKNPQGITSKSRGKVKILDTYWISEQLLHDRETLKLHNDITFAKVMLQQVKTNYHRIKTLGRSDIDRAVFVLTADLWNKYFSNIKSTSPLAKALAMNDFLQYKVSIEFDL